MLRLPSCFLFGLTPAITGRQRAAKAKHRPYVAVVLSRSEVEAVLSHLETPYHLVALLLYGCGLRLSECLELRVQCFNLEAMLLHGARRQRAEGPHGPAATTRFAGNAFGPRAILARTEARVTGDSSLSDRSRCLKKSGRSSVSNTVNIKIAFLPEMRF